jgi:AraC family transcriptional regulator of adaptative response/methylated-DNA-[protein]-cysteine methyltransferase
MAFKDRRTIINFNLETSLGLLSLQLSEKGLCSANFCYNSSIKSQKPKSAIERQKIKEVKLEIESFIAAKLDSFSSNLDLQGTEFQKKVWKELKKIPRGETRTYRQIATALACPKAYRAVANACASNKLALFIPCHRVIRSDGSLGGYRWGLALKDRLLKIEAF